MEMQLLGKFKCFMAQSHRWAHFCGGLAAVGMLFGYAALAQLPYVVRSRKAMTIKHGNMSVSVGEPTGADDGEEDQDPC